MKASTAIHTRAASSRRGTRESDRQTAPRARIAASSHKRRTATAATINAPMPTSFTRGSRRCKNPIDGGHVFGKQRLSGYVHQSAGGFFDEALTPAVSGGGRPQGQQPVQDNANATMRPTPTMAETT